MNPDTNPIEYLIQCCETIVNTGKLKLTYFTILNAKNELKKLRETQEWFNDIQPVAWVRLNNKGDLYDPRLHFNPYVNEDTVLPLYSNKKEFQEKYGKLSK